MDQFQDRKLACEGCGNDFVFSVGEQKFFLQKAFAEPRRCPDCRKGRKKDRRKKRRQLLKTLETREAVNVSVEDNVETKEAVAGEEPKVEEQVEKDAVVPPSEDSGEGPAAPEEGPGEPEAAPAETETEPAPAS